MRTFRKEKKRKEKTMRFDVKWRNEKARIIPGCPVWCTHLELSGWDYACNSVTLPTHTGGCLAMENVIKDALVCGTFAKRQNAQILVMWLRSTIVSSWQHQCMILLALISSFAECPSLATVLVCKSLSAFYCSFCDILKGCQQHTTAAIWQHSWWCVM